MQSNPRSGSGFLAASLAGNFPGTQRQRLRKRTCGEAGAGQQEKTSD
ncbi:MAG: hypothetical protein IH935_05240 [Acidobacteria bacterium]|nr:hypothetical protein [Acidobacteriota bacterium]